MPTWNEVQQKIASSKYSDVAGMIFDMTADDPDLDRIIAGLSGENGDTLRKIFESAKLTWFTNNNLMARLVSERKWTLIQKLQPVLSRITELPEKAIFSDALLAVATEFAKGGLPGRNVNLGVRAACISLLSVKGLSMSKRGNEPFLFDARYNNYHLSVIESFAFAGDAELYVVARAAGAVVATELGFRNISHIPAGDLSGSCFSLAIHNKQWGMLLKVFQSEFSGDCLTHFGEIADAAARLLPSDEGVTLFQTLMNVKRQSGDLVQDFTKQYYERVMDALIYHNKMGFLKVFMTLTGYRLDMVPELLKAAVAFSGKRESAEYDEMREIVSNAVGRIVQMLIWVAMDEVLSKSRSTELTGNTLTQFKLSLDRLIQAHLGDLNAELTRKKEGCVGEFLGSLGEAKKLAATRFEQATSSGEVLTTRLFAPLATLIAAAFFDEGLDTYPSRVNVLRTLAERWLVEKRHQIAEQAPDQIVLRAQQELLSLVMAITAHQKGLNAEAVDAVIAFLPTVFNMPNQNTIHSKKTVVDPTLKTQPNGYLFAQVVKTVVSAIVQLEVQCHGYCHPRIAVVAAREVVTNINQKAGLGIAEETLEHWLTDGFSDRNLGGALKSSLRQGSMFANAEFGVASVIDDVVPALDGVRF